MKNSDPPESDLLKPVLRLFPKKRYRRFQEVPFGRKKIDLWCVSRTEGEAQEVCIECKVRDWRRALWQATINFQMAKQSYIAIWHRYIQRVEKQAHLLKQYGVGLISVEPKRAKIIIRSQKKVLRISKEEKRELYRNLINV